MSLHWYIDVSSRLAMAVSLRDALLKCSGSSYSNFRDCSLFELLVEHLDIVIHNESID